LRSQHQVAPFVLACTFKEGYLNPAKVFSSLDSPKPQASISTIPHPSEVGACPRAVCRQMELNMKKYSLLLTLLSLLAFTVMVQAQNSRPRRVGDDNVPQTSTTAPTRPPVLGGANYPNNRQPAPPQTQQQTGPEEVDAGDIIKVNTTLVTIPVSVMDRDGRYVPNLRKEDFRLWEDGVEQQVAFFSSVDKPFSVVLMLDTSPSTQFRLEDIQDAAIAFVNQLRADDKVMVVSFNDDINVLCDLTTDRSKLERAIRHAHTGDGTR